MNRSSLLYGCVTISHPQYHDCFFVKSHSILYHQHLFITATNVPMAQASLLLDHGELLPRYIENIAGIAKLPYLVSELEKMSFLSGKKVR